MIKNIHLTRFKKYKNHEFHIHAEGLGMSAEDFLPLAVPSLNHLWTNLKTQLSPSEKKHWKN